MEWLNYHHLLYFHTVAREGSVTRAAEILGLAQPTLSGQIRKLEAALGEKLFQKRGRNLALTDVGRHVERYASEIFSLGRELVDTVKGAPTGHLPARLHVGIVDVVPKIIAHRLLEAVLALDPPVRLILHEGKARDLLAALGAHEYDVVLADVPIGPQVSVKAFNHSLGDCAIGFFAEHRLARRLRRTFPESLHEAPLLMPTDNTALRKSLDRWLDTQDLHPTIVAEIEDTALMKVFAQHGVGLFAAPTVLAEELREVHKLHQIGEIEEIREHFYAITVERRITHPAVVAIVDAARHGILSH